MFVSVLYRILAVCLLLSAGLLRPAAAQTPLPVAPQFDMAQRVLAPTTNGQPFPMGLAVDARGNSYLCGQVSSAVLFNGAPSPPGADSYLAKIGPDGTHRWVVYFTTGDNTGLHSSSVAVDAAGTVYLAGQYLAAPFAPGGTVSLPNAGGRDVFVARIDSSGRLISAARGGGPGDEFVRRIEVDAAGNAYLTGRFSGSASFGSTTLTSAGGTDQFVARLDVNGTWRWAQRLGASGDDIGYGLSLDQRGHVYVSGHARVPVAQFGPLTMPAANNYVVRLQASTGAFQRAHPVVSPGAAPSDILARTTNLAADAAGNCYVGGSFLGTVQFGSFTLVNPSSTVSLEDAFLAKLDTAGRWAWAQVVVDGTAGEYLSDLATDARSNVYFAGSFRSLMTHFGPYVLTPQNQPIGLYDIYVAKLNAAGAWQWLRQAGGPQADYVSNLVLGPYASPYLAGEYSFSSLTLPPFTLPGVTSGAPRSAYVGRLQPNELRIAGDSVVCPGGSTRLTASTFAPGSALNYRWNTGATTASISVTQPGTYTVTATLAGGYTLSEQFRVRSIPAPTVQISGAAAPLCPGTPRQLTATAPGAVAFLWSTGATTASISASQPGTYSVTATFSAACSATAQVTITSNTLAISGRQQLCPGQSTTLSTTVGGAAVTSYRWSTGATTPTLLVGQAGTYAVTATFADGCQLTRTHQVGPPQARVASVSGDTLLCPNTTLQLTALNPDALTYTWNTGATTADIRVSRPGRYAVTLTYAGGCSSSDSLLVEAAPLAPAFALGADTTLCLEQPLLLRAQVLRGPGLRHRWSDGSTGPTFTVTEPGTYALTVTSLCDARTVTRRVAYQSCLFLPNVITPNGDGQNDSFVVNGLPKGDWELRVFNRWGREVYRARAYRHDWGRDAAPGTYFYRLSQGSVSYKGHVEVIR